MAQKPGLVMRRFGRALAVGILALTPLMPAGVSLAAIPQGNQGLQDGWAIDNDGKVSGGTHLLSDGEFAFMRNAGAGWVRINFRLGDCFHDWTTRVAQADVGSGLCHASTLNHTAVDQYVQVVGAARGQGLRVLGLVTGESVRGSQAEWVANNAEHNTNGNGDNPYIRRLANVTGVLAGRFKGSVAVEEWEVWSEPNAWDPNLSNPSAGVFAGSSFIYPSNFAQLMKQSNAAIKRANPAALVVAGGMFSHDAATATTVTVKPNGVREVTLKRGVYTAPAAGREAPQLGTMPDAGVTQSAAVTKCTSVVPSGADYLCQTYVMGRSKAGWAKLAPFDHVSQHIYVDQGGLTSPAKISQFLDEVRQAYVAFDGAGTSKRTEITEFGWSSFFSGMTEDIQAQNLRVAFGVFHSTSYVRRAFWFRTQDLPWDGYGLVGFEWNGPAVPKPAFTAYQQTGSY